MVWAEIWGLEVTEKSTNNPRIFPGISAREMAS